MTGQMISLDLFSKEQRDTYLQASRKKSWERQKTPTKSIVINNLVSDKDYSPEQSSGRKENTWDSNTWEDEDFHENQQQILIDESIVLSSESSLAKVQTHKDVLDHGFNIFR